MGIPPRLLAEMEGIAAARVCSINEVLVEAVDLYIKEQQWSSLKRYGLEKARERGIGEGNVLDAIRESRQEHRR
ncbi:MAG: hypothetical protein ABI383_15615 [Acidobacteriaceae bacterium]